MSVNTKSVSFQVRGICLQAVMYTAPKPDKEQEPEQVPARTPIIGLHGWLDNAASFELLAPVLAQAGFTFLALDLAGQGLSGMRPLSASYHLWDDAVDVMNIADQLDWQHFILMGHSRGAMIASMLAASFPERIQQVALFDGVLPIPVEFDETVEQFRRFVTGFQSRRESRHFATRDDAIKIRAKASGMNEAGVELLAKRGLFESVDAQGVSSWQWRVDERLKTASALKMTDAHNRAWLAALIQAKSKVWIALADKGLAQMPIMARYEQDFPSFHWQHFPGSHHQHMQEESGVIAKACLNFLLASEQA